jgi:hypothetical protein
MSDVDLENEALVRAYHVVFGSPDGQIVLADLAPFCRAAETCFDRDPRIHAALEGRREVWLRIAKFSKLTNEQIMHLIARRRPIPQVEIVDG